VRNGAGFAEEISLLPSEIVVGDSHRAIVNSGKDIAHGP